MAVNNIRWRWYNLDSWRREVDRVTNTYEVVGVFEGVLAEQFALSQSQVSSAAHPHVPTYTPGDDTHPLGRLFESGHPTTDFDGETWEGSIIYDAENDQGAIYAVYEMARGGIHDWFNGVEEMGDGPSGYIGALESHFDGG